MQKNINQEKVWDALAEQWYHFRQQPFKDVEEELERLSDQKKGKILEIGCGNCRNLVIFAKKGFDCYGIDFSSEMIKQAKKFCKKQNIKIKLRKANATKLPFQSNSFDYILNIATLHHLNKKEQEKSLKEMHRVLKPKGKILVSVWKKPFGKEIKPLSKELKKTNEKIKEYYLAWHVGSKVLWRYYYVFNLNELKKLFKDNGFKVLKEKQDKNLILIVRKD